MRHPIYVATDPITYPNSVFRIQHSFIHDNITGNSIKSRARRLEVYFNWIENNGANDNTYYTLEVVGYDGKPVPDGHGINADIVGNVLIHKSPYGMRFGGDGTGSSRGRVRFAHNTVLMTTAFPTTAPVWRFFGLSDENGNPGAIEAFAADDNVIFRQGGGAVRLVRDITAAEDPADPEVQWVGTPHNITGRNNLIPAAATHVPAGFTGTLTADPGYTSLSNVTTPLLTSPVGAAIRGAGLGSLTPASGFDPGSALTTLPCQPQTVPPDLVCRRWSRPRP